MPVLTQNQLKITHHSLPFQRFPKTLDTLRVVQLSDMHFYQYTDRDFYNKVIETLYELKPGLIFLTGDLIHYGDHFLDLAASYLEQINTQNWGKTQPGMFAILGNHDYFDYQFSKATESMLTESGFQVLRNRSVLWQPNYDSKTAPTSDAAIQIIGLDDLWYGTPDIAEAVVRDRKQDSASASDYFTLGLIHNPLLFDPLSHSPNIQVDLVMAGHTHAGHVYLPFLAPIYRHLFKVKYRYGFYEQNNSKLYVSSGIGSAALYYCQNKLKPSFSFGTPRFRFNTHPELVVFDLSAA